MNKSYKVINIQSLQNNRKFIEESARLQNKIKKKELTILPQGMIDTLSKQISDILKPQEELTINNQKLIKDEDKSMFMLVINNQMIILNVLKSVMSLKYKLSLEEKTLFFNNNPIGYEGKLKFTQLFSKILKSKNKDKFEMIISKKGEK